ncbi:Hypothetical predicted protein [Paramuricea clavata]|uniref:Uncharacterized protein n=1 Tax=Paramuricea clavata TaxID=317549 RepID=A0A6S7HI49_PARCT|nr:Hypothetical predicted protein [Paramuricea clavata]
MNQTSSVDFLILKENLLQMWLPVKGAQTVPEFCRLNWEKIAVYMFQMNIIPFTFKNNRGEEFCKRQVFKTSFENYFDAQPPFQLGEAILSGSFSEGLFLYSSETPDMDVMCVLKNITFSEGDQEDGNLQLREDTPFVYAFVTNNETQHLWACFFDEADKQTGKYRLSSKKLKEKLGENYQKTGRIFRSDCNEKIDEFSEGAAVTIRKIKPSNSISFFQSSSEIAKEVLRHPKHKRCKIKKELSEQMRVDALYKIIPSCDIVLSIYCEGWPLCALEWITRERLWPDVSLVEEITQRGFHIIPKSSADGDFRLSFSCAETMLIKTLAPLQHKVMRAFKAVAKYSQNAWNPNLNEIITTYHLKTIAFWHFEKTSPESWIEDSLVHHLVTLLEELAEALRIQSLPMYFMPMVNLLQDVDDPEVTINLMEKISSLSHNYSAMSEAVNNFKRNFFQSL